MRGIEYKILHRNFCVDFTSVKIRSLKIFYSINIIPHISTESILLQQLFYYGAPTYRKNEHYNIQGKQTGIVLSGGIAAVGL